MSEIASRIIRPKGLDGKFVVVEATKRGVRRVRVTSSSETPSRRVGNQADQLADHGIDELASYFEGRRRRFRTPLDFDGAGTLFQRSVWERLLEIPFGEIESYGDVARAVGSPRAVRAVGQAVGSNPIPVIVPCRRVVGSDGRRTGYTGGLHIKEFLLTLERGHA